MIKKYRKKPIIIEAMQWKKGYTDWKDICKFCGNYLGGITPLGLPILKTLEGSMTVSDGDYIIKGIAGEIYPCKSYIFETTYEEVEDDE